MDRHGEEIQNIAFKEIVETLSQIRSGNLNIHPTNRSNTDSLKPIFDELNALVQDLQAQAQEAVTQRESATAAEVLLSEIVDALPLFITVMDKNQQPKFMSGEYRRFLGTRLADLREKGLSVIFPQGIVDTLAACKSEALNGRETRAVVPHIDPVNGARTWLNLRFLPSRAQDGSVQGLILLGEDVTVRIEAQRLLEQSESKLAASNSELLAVQGRLLQMVDALDRAAIVAETDTRGKITRVNEKFEKLSGYSREELIGQDHRIINSGIHDKSFFSELWATIRGGKVWTGEITNRAKDGTTYWVQTVITPVLDAMGDIKKFIAIRFDVSPVKRREAEIERQRVLSIQSAKLASLGEMAVGVGHEINNPLGVIHAKARQMIKALSGETPDLTKVREGLAVVSAQADRIAKIVSSLRTFSRDDSAASFEAVEIQTIINETYPLYSERFSAGGVLLRTSVPSMLPLVNCRPVQISQILVNLLMNAFDTVSGSKSPWVTLDVAEVEGGVSFIITDSGTGIPDNIARRIFEPFFTTKDIGKGTGLGLSVSAAIAKDHGGTLTLDVTSPNTAFVLFLPTANNKKSAV